ncbi:hypothetical protein K435DRAFT_867909 [Dendrothele bispora CBS 962.96]|uniref:Uncharacterized protein n=1 Tax=Dendrothele bispora (strain CBS 962.96) TaxID=1314807 RepID=A0A4S8LD46_DENBC|nr:hypothetical protein K435DRAFT_867909 [Dendrothele bispora CBS 962.96]
MAENSSTETDDIIAENSNTENENARMGSSMRPCRMCFLQVIRQSTLLFCPKHGFWLQVRIIKGDRWPGGRLPDEVYYRIPDTYMNDRAEAWFKEHGPPLNELPR